MTIVLQSDSCASQRTFPRQHLTPLLCALVGVATYACSLRGTYLLDDVYSVRQDPRVTNGLWRAIWTEAYRTDCFDKLYRPLVNTSFAVEWALHGDRPWLFHLVTLLLHGAVTAMLVVLVRRVRDERAALIAGMLFAVLPIHTEAVVNIVGRAESMCALATLYGLYAFLTRPLGGRLMLTLAVCFLFAACSKEQGILFPLILLAAVPLRNAQRLPTASAKTRQLFVAVFLWLPALYLVFRQSMVPMWWDRSIMYWESNPIIRAHGLDRLLLPVVVFGHYVQITLVPLKLTYDYSGLAIGYHVRLTDPYLYLGLTCALALGGVGVWSIRKRRWVTFLAVAGLAITYGLVSNSVVIIGTLMGERLTYLPTAFFLLLVAGPLGRLYCPALVVGMALLVSLYVVRSVSYGILWNDPAAFARYTLDHQPRGMFGHGGMYVYEAQRGDWAAALIYAEDARRLMPDAAAPHWMCIQAQMNLGRFADAERSAEFALKQPILDIDKYPIKRMWWDAHYKLLAQATTQPAPTTQMTK